MTHTCGARCGPFRCQLYKGHETDERYRRHEDWGSAWTFTWMSERKGSGFIFAKWFVDRPSDWAPGSDGSPGYCYDSKRTIDKIEREE